MQDMILLKKIQFFHLENLNYDNLFQTIKTETLWDKSMKSRWTASYGTPYNYNDSIYGILEEPSYIKYIMDYLNLFLGYRPNNCLINFYNEKESKMGYHADNIDILEDNTGITILSLGSKRIMKFKNQNNEKLEVILEPNTFFHMSSELQKTWKHSILPINDSNLEVQFERISLTFRKIKKS